MYSVIFPFILLLILRSESRQIKTQSDLTFVLGVIVYHPFNTVFVPEHPQVRTPGGCPPIGISTCPPAESPLNNLSASSLLSALMIEILLLFSFRWFGPTSQEHHWPLGRSFQLEEQCA